MGKFTLTLEPFSTNPNYYYLDLNGRNIAVLTPSDLNRVMEMIGHGVTANAKRFVADAVRAQYPKEER